MMAWSPGRRVSDPSSLQSAKRLASGSAALPQSLQPGNQRLPAGAGLSPLGRAPVAEITTLAAEGAIHGFADALRRLIANGIKLDGASDHGVSEALYLRDPDENGIELYRDRAEAEWPRNADGSLAMVTKRLDLESLLQEKAPAY